MTKQELIDLINMAYEAVEESNLGKMREPHPNGEGEIMHTIPANTFIAIVTKLIPNDLHHEMRDQKEEWES